MNPKSALIAVVACAGLFAGCDRAKEPENQNRAENTPAAGQAQPQVSAAAESSKKSTTTPIQGQVDTKEPNQRRDFETRR